MLLRGRFPQFPPQFLSQTLFGLCRLCFDLRIWVRFDIAFPVRKPYLPEGSRWVLHPIDSAAGPGGVPDTSFLISYRVSFSRFLAPG